MLHPLAQRALIHDITSISYVGRATLQAVQTFTILLRVAITKNMAIRKSVRAVKWGIQAVRKISRANICFFLTLRKALGRFESRSEFIYTQYALIVSEMSALTYHISHRSTYARIVFALQCTSKRTTSHGFTIQVHQSQYNAFRHWVALKVVASTFMYIYALIVSEMPALTYHISHYSRYARIGFALQCTSRRTTPHVFAIQVHHPNCGAKKDSI